MKTTLVVCESPWMTNGRFKPWSMRPFVEGLGLLHEVRLLYRTFTTDTELKQLLGSEAVDKPAGRVIVYIACHGSGGRFVLPSGEHNLASIAIYLRPGIEGVWLGACDVGASRALQQFSAVSGAIWAGGYACAVDWDTSLLLDLAVLQAAIRMGPISDKAAVLRMLKRAFRGFNADWTVGVDKRGVRVSLADSVRVVARDRRRGARPMLITEDLCRSLKWSK
jgi:hypothetical protein